MSRTTVFLCCAFLFWAHTATGESGGEVKLPPLSNGGIAGLWASQHRHILDKFGDFELLNNDNVPFTVATDDMSDTAWKLVAFGNYLPKGIQFATLARCREHRNGLLLIMFEWIEPADTSSYSGVFFTSFLGSDTLLIRNKQGITGELDTLEFSCEDGKPRCGIYFYNKDTGTMSLLRTGKKD